MLRFDGLLFWRFFFHARGPRTVRLAHTVQLFLCVKTSWMSFFCHGLVYSFGQQKTFFPRPTRSCFGFPMPEEDLWCLKKPDEPFHSRRHRPRRRHHESRLVAPRTPIWLSHTHFAWQTKLWLSGDFSVRFNQNLLKQCTHTEYYIRLSG